MAGRHSEWGPRRAQARARRGCHCDRTPPAMCHDGGKELRFNL
jgi:hypothetical protein